MTHVFSLTDDILKLILQDVPLKDRVTSCCLVHNRFQAAELAVAGALDLAEFPAIRSPERAQSFLGWLDQYGERLTSLKMAEFPQPLLQLPCPNLLELSLGAGCCVQLAPSAAEDGSPGVIHGCSKLTRLELQCSFSDTPKGQPVLDSLSSLVDLQHLVVSPADLDTTALAGSTLPPFALLTTLTASCMDVGFLDNLAHNSSLLELTVLPSPNGITVGPSMMPALELPDSLTKLALECPIETGLLSLVPETLRELYIDGRVVGPVDAFLFNIGRLQHLTALLLDTLEGLGDWPPPGPAYNAFTGSSSLVSVTLDELKLPEGVLPYVFPAARKLPHLTTVCIQDFVDTADGGATPAWSPADLSSLMECCPNLGNIDRAFLHTGPHVSELHKLTALTRLDVVFVPGDLPAYEESLRGLAAITQLQDLSFEMTRNNLTVGSLLPLTDLTALTSLSCEWEASAAPMAPAGADPTAAVEDTRFTFTAQVRNSRPPLLLAPCSLQALSAAGESVGPSSHSMTCVTVTVVGGTHSSSALFSPQPRSPSNIMHGGCLSRELLCTCLPLCAGCSRSGAYSCKHIRHHPANLLTVFSCSCAGYVDRRVTAFSPCGCVCCCAAQGVTPRPLHSSRSSCLAPILWLFTGE
jgi:hypothetical protein